MWKMEEGKEKEFEKWAKEWLKDKKARLCDHGFKVNAKKEWFLYDNIQELFNYCITFPYYICSYNDMDNLPTSWGLLPKRIKVWKHFENLPEGIKSAIIKANDRREDKSDIEYNSRKQYFIENRITLEELVKQNNLQTCIDKVHQFTFIKNKNASSQKSQTYKIVDFIHDLETKRLKIVPCCGCYPIFQPNQLAHIGGCMFDVDSQKKTT